MSIKDFVFVRRGEVFVNQLEESLSYICFYVLAVRGIVPYSVALSVSSLRSVAVAVLVVCKLLV